MTGRLELVVSVDEASPVTMTVSVRGELDAGEVSRVDRIGSDLRDDLAEVVVDLAGATIIDSSGLGALIRLRDRCVASSIGFRTLVDQPFQWTLMSVTGLVDVLGVVDRRT